MLEECDSPGEFFYDNRTGELYYYMNSTAEAQDPGTDYVGSNIEMLVRASGTSAATPIKNVRFSNITFAHTASTFLSSYSTKLGGGDYAVHNGAAVWVSKSEGFRLDGCLFDRVGGTAVMLYGYIRGAVIDSNEFFSTGAHAIVSWGTSELVDGTTPDHVEGTVVTNNLAHEIGIWEKQTCFWMQALTTGTILKNNIAFNGARALINFNDGFGGGNVVESNLLFNGVRETGDHGPFNSYDRQPFFTTVADPKGNNPSYAILENRIARNLIISNFYSKVPLDHDDGSCFYRDTENVMVFGGTKNFYGNHKMASNSLYIYPEYISVLDGAGDHSAARGRLASARDMLARTRTEMLHKSRAAAGVASNAAAAAAAAAAGLTEIERLPFCCESLQTNSSEHSGEGDSWINNTCITTVGTPYLFDPSPCNGTRLFPNLAGNTFQVPRNHLLHFPVCNGSLQNGDASLAKWQLMVNQDGSAADAGSHYGPIPSDDALIAKAKALLQF